MNDPRTTQHLSANKTSYSATDLERYLTDAKSILFLACYSYDDVYFGNLRIYEIAGNIASFGRLIGNPAYRGLGYGKVMNELAASLIFDFFGYPTIIVGNKKDNEPSALSKLQSGFRKLAENELPQFLETFDEDGDYFIKRSQS